MTTDSGKPHTSSDQSPAVPERPDARNGAQEPGPRPAPAEKRAARDTRRDFAPDEKRRDTAPGEKRRDFAPGDRDRGLEGPQRPAREGRGFGKGRDGDPARDRDGKSFRAKEDEPRGGAPGSRTTGAAAALIELDRDLMKLLVRRATLVSRIRGGKDHAASPAAIQAEKAVRLAWESGALAFSKDPRFSRQLFSLLQDIKVLSKEKAGAAGSFRLTPPAREISGSLCGPSCARSAQMRLCLAAFLGRPLALENASLCAALLDTVKTCAQAGAEAAYHYTGNGTGKVTLAGGRPLAPSDKSLYAGEDIFSLYLMAFFAAGKPGIWRFTGGGRLKSADLSALRHILPLFGARLAHVVPHSQALPANLECSGEIPPLVVVPPELPFEALCALLLAPLVWDAPVTLNLAALPAATATAALAEVRPLHREAGAEVETHGPHIVFNQAQLTLPETPALPLDPVLAAYLLALPAFAGGGLTLRGAWPGRSPEAVQAGDLLAWAGLALADSGSSLSVRALGEPFTMPLQASDFSPKLLPLFLALAALRQSLSPEKALPQPPPLPQDEADLALAAEFLGLLGLRLEEGRLVSGENEGRSEAWTSPDAFWSLGLCLAAYLKPGLMLANPGGVSEVMPSFWSIYNSLPEPRDPALAPPDRREEKSGDRPARRRVIAD